LSHIHTVMSCLFFQVIGDRIGIPSALVRGEFTRAWNEVALSMEYEVHTVGFLVESLDCRLL